MKARAVAPWLQAALAGSAVLAVADAILRLQRAAVAGSILAGSGGFAAVQAADRRVIALARAELVWGVVPGILFLVWVGFAYSDLVRSGVRHQLAVPLAVVGPVIPFASLVLVPRTMDDLTRQGRYKRPPTMAWWFAFLLLTGVAIRTAVLVLGDGGVVEYQRSDRVFAVADVLLIITAVLLIGLVRVVTDRADDRRRESAALAAADEADDPEAMGQAIGWYRDPRRQAEVRWWDGTAWTTHVASTRQAPPPSARAGTESFPAFGTAEMPRTAKLSLFAGILAFLVFPAPVALVLGLFALRDLRRQPGAPGKARAWFAVIVGGLMTLLLVIGVAFGE